MTAQIAGFISRADAGLRKPNNFSSKITPDQGGVALHYGGPAQKITRHGQCAARWKAWQTYHMDTHGWADIAYTLGVCDHGYVLAGRGANVRTAANGTNSGNQNYYAVTWIGGEGETPTSAALDAIEWSVLHLRKAGAGRKVKPHRYFKSTGCPGDPLVKKVASRLDGADIAEPPTPTASGGTMYAVYTGTDGLDWGTDLFSRRPFETQDAKAAWITLVQRVQGKKVVRITLSAAEQELLIPLGTGL